MSMDAVVKSRINHAVQVSREVVVAGTYVYPLKGVYYLLSHSNLYGMVASRLLPTIALGLTITLVMFFFTYVPQAAVLTLLNGPLGIVNAISLVLSESATLTMMLARSFTLKETLVDIFDATLVSEGEDNLVSKGRELKAGRGFKGANALGKNLIKPPERSLLHQLANYVMLLPLNFIPLVGTALFLVSQGTKAGPGFHARYFQLKKYDEKEQHEEVVKQRGGYVGFGTAAIILNLLPMGTIFFTFTSTVGAALWAADLEKARQRGRAASPKIIASS